MNWSMIPQFMPTNSFSARWQRRANTGPSSCQSDSAWKSTAVATSMAADELSPAPRGTFPSRAASSPGSDSPSPCRIRATPRT